MSLEAFQRQLSDHMTAMSFLNNLTEAILKAGEILIDTIGRSQKILVCGNGGSAADAQHFAAKLVARFERERPAWPGIALTTNTSVMTAIGNDYSFQDVFSRQVEALGGAGDTLISISTSGNSPNILKAAQVAREKGLGTIAILGRDGGTIHSEVDLSIVVPSSVTARIQEAHCFILHFWCSMIEQRLSFAEPILG